MPSTPGAPLATPHRDRLRSCGVPGAVLDDLDLRLVTDAFDWWPQWWEQGGNALYVRAGYAVPEQLLRVMLTYPFSGALVVLGTDVGSVSSLLVGGDGATVFVGPDTYLSATELYCGGGSAIILNGGVVATSRAIVDARNGGSVVAEHDQLWAANVVVTTDDMHRLEDLATGERLNPYGAHIRLGRHVWLCRDAIVTGNTEIGECCVVGARAMVRSQKVAANTAVAGTPARVIREGITWSGDDTP